jgi:putative DNA primase/helicase
VVLAGSLTCHAERVNGFFELLGTVGEESWRLGLSDKPAKGKPPATAAISVEPEAAEKRPPTKAKGPPPKAKPIPIDTPNWHNLLVRSKRGEIVRCARNAQIALEYETGWKGIFAYNTFAGEIETMWEPPWGKSFKPNEAPTKTEVRRYWSEEDTVRLAMFLTERLGCYVGKDEVRDALIVLARQRQFHPVHEWLETLKWDGKERLGSVFIRHAGVSDEHVIRSVTAKWMIGLVKRIYEPGCVFRMVLILEGEQDTRKSTVLEALAVRKEWFMAFTANMADKDAYQVLRGAWLVELAELDSLNKTATSAIKGFISNPTDKYRPSYGRGPIMFPRQCGYGGTTNEHDYLKDATGNTRFYPITIGRVIDVEAIIAERDQLWAEAVHRYKKGEPCYITDTGVKAALAARVEARRQIHPWEEVIAKWLERLTPFRRNQGVTTYEILTGALQKHPSDFKQADTQVIASIFRTLRWTKDGRKEARRSDGKRDYLYFPPRPGGPLKVVGKVDEEPFKVPTAPDEVENDEQQAPKKGRKPRQARQPQTGSRAKNGGV